MKKGFYEFQIFGKKHIVVRNPNQKNVYYLHPIMWEILATHMINVGITLPKIKFKSKLK